MAAGAQLKVKIVYRNYKPLHKALESLVENPPPGVKYTVPRPVDGLSRLFFVYRRHKNNRLVKTGIRLINRLVFAAPKAGEEVDLYHFVNMVANDVKSVDRPFIVDMERATSLTGFSKDDKIVRSVIEFLADPKCRAIVCWSRAARTSLKQMAGADWPRLESKTEVIYPTIPIPRALRADHSIISDKSKLNLLFVGNQAGRKGLPDLLEAVKQLDKKYPERVNLYVVSSEARPLINKYDLSNVHLFAPNYSKDQILQKFFLPADLFVFPTRGDTYGMAVVDSLAVGTPVITTGQFALPELISDKKDGRLIKFKDAPLDKYLFIPRETVKRINSTMVDRTMVAKLIEVLEPLIKDSKPLATWSKQAKRKFVGSNQLSPLSRSRKYASVYRHASKNT